MTGSGGYIPATQVLGEEAEWNWGLFFANIENTEYKDSFVDTIADYAVQVLSCALLKTPSLFPCRPIPSYRTLHVTVFSTSCLS